MGRGILWLAAGIFLAVASISSRGSAQVFNTRSTNMDLATRDYVLTRPTVSPYLNLLRRESALTPPNYHTLVRPALEARQRAAQQEGQIRQLQARVVNMQGQSALRGRQREGFTTGHPVRFMTYLHYYPALNRR